MAPLPLMVSRPDFFVSASSHRRPLDRVPLSYRFPSVWSLVWAGRAFSLPVTCSHAWPSSP